MNFIKNINSVHWILLGAFSFLYLVFIFRTVVSAIRLRSSFRHIFIKLIIRSSYFVLILIATLAPTFGSDKKKVLFDSKDIVFAIDLSLSMNCRDLSPNRLEVAKREIKKLVEQIPNNRIGLLAFASSSFTYCPLTTDYGAFHTFLSSMKVNSAFGSYTDFSSALQDGIHMLSEKNNHAKILVLVSDGENFGENYLPHLEVYKKANIKILTLAVGTYKGAQVIKDMRPLKDNTGEIAISYLKPENMKEISSFTDGNFFEVSEDHNSMKQLTTYIQNIQGHEHLDDKMRVPSDKYVYFVAFALILIIIDLMTNIEVIKI